MEKGAAVEVRPLFVAARVGDLCPAISRPHIAENRPERGEVLQTAFAIIDYITGCTPFLSPILPNCRILSLFIPKNKKPRISPRLLFVFSVRRANFFQIAAL